MTTDLRKRLHNEINEIEAAVGELAAGVIEVLPAATGALLAGDLEMISALISHDAVLNQQTTDIEERCFRLLALQQPLAIDLRAVTATLRIAGELERCGDLVVNIAKAGRRLYGLDIPARLRDLVSAMSNEAGRILRLAMDAYRARSASLGTALADIDDRLDQLQRDLVGAIFETQATHDVDLMAAVQFALLARFYERIGDHAVNIGERVAFIASSHTDGDPDKSTEPVPEDE